MLDKEIREKIELIQLKAERFVNSVVQGEYTSAFKGKGLEFETVRAYIPGDDIRSIDWNVTSRVGSLHVKQYHEERELKIYLLLDLSGSGLSEYQGVSKRDVLAQVSAALSFVAMRTQDAVGLLLFSDKVELFVPPAKGKTQTVQLLKAVLEFQPEGHQTDLTAALNFIGKTAEHDSLVIIMSDFHDQGYEKALSITAQHFETIAIVPYSLFDFELPSVGLLSVSDGEGGLQKEIDTSSAKVREAWRLKNEKAQRELRRLFLKLNISSLDLYIDKPWDWQLIQFFLKRIHSSRR